MARTYNPVIDQGADWLLNINYTDVDGNPVLLSGYTAKMKIKEELDLTSNPVTIESLKATVTGVSASGGTVTYTANNSFTAGQKVTITGVNPTAYNLSNVTIASANSTTFTVTNAATGSYVSGGLAMAAKGITITAATGNIDLHITAAQTALLTKNNYVYDLKITDPDGVATRLLQGTISVSSEISNG